MRTLLISDSLAMSLMALRPEGLWDLDWADQRNKNLLSPEWGLQYVAAHLQGQGFPFEVLNVMGDADVDPDFLRRADKALVDDEIAAEMDAWVGQRWSDVLDEVERIDPDVILWPMMYYFMIGYVRKLLGEVRERVPRAKVVVGGNYATIHADEVARYATVDYVVVGEGEHTALALLQALAAGDDVSEVEGLCYVDDKGEVFRTAPRARENDLDVFPHVYTVGEQFRIGRRHEILCELIPYGDYWPGTGIITARGCPEKCSFCLDPAIWNRKVRFHSARYIADVVAYCKEHYPSEHNRFFFGDSTFTLRWNRLEPLLEMLGEIGMNYTCQTRADALDEKRIETMSEVGFVTIGIGAESMNNDVLNQIALKREDVSEIVDAARMCRSFGIQPVLTLIAGFPGESKESLIETVDVLRREGLHVSSFFALVVFRGMGLFDGFGDVEGFTQSGDFWEHRDEKARLNEWTEEWLRLSEEFPTKEELLGFTQYLNQRVRLPIEETIPA